MDHSDLFCTFASVKEILIMVGIIYSRVSSVGDRQSTKRQVVDLTSFAEANNIEVANVFEEHVSGAAKNADRPIFCEALEYAKTNKVDVILFSELSRCGRSISEVLKTINLLVDEKINAFFQKENLYLLKDGVVNPITYVIISCLAMCAQMERDNIKFRLNSGRELAKSNPNVKFGRPIGSIKTEDKKREQYAEVIKLLKKGLSVANVEAICKTKGIKASTSTIKRIKKEFLSNE